jgi:hypothetical protein
LEIVGRSGQRYSVSRIPHTLLAVPAAVVLMP